MSIHVDNNGATKYFKFDHIPTSAIILPQSSSWMLGFENLQLLARASGQRIKILIIPKTQDEVDYGMTVEDHKTNKSFHVEAKSFPGLINAAIIEYQKTFGNGKTWMINS